MCKDKGNRTVEARPFSPSAGNGAGRIRDVHGLANNARHLLLRCYSGHSTRVDLIQKNCILPRLTIHHHVGEVIVETSNAQKCQMANHRVSLACRVPSQRPA